MLRKDMKVWLKGLNKYGKLEAHNRAM
jgi:hypothetical protein